MNIPLLTDEEIKECKTLLFANFINGYFHQFNDWWTADFFSISSSGNLRIDELRKIQKLLGHDNKVTFRDLYLEIFEHLFNNGRIDVLKKSLSKRSGYFSIPERKNYDKLLSNFLERKE